MADIYIWCISNSEINFEFLELLSTVTINEPQDMGRASINDQTSDYRFCVALNYKFTARALISECPEKTSSQL